MTQQSFDFKHVGDVVAAGVSAGWLMQIIPDVVVVLNGIYVLFRLYDWIEGKVTRGRTKQDKPE